MLSHIIRCLVISEFQGGDEAFFTCSPKFILVIVFAKKNSYIIQDGYSALFVVLNDFSGSVLTLIDCEHTNISRNAENARRKRWVKRELSKEVQKSA